MSIRLRERAKNTITYIRTCLRIVVGGVVDVIFPPRTSELIVRMLSIGELCALSAPTYIGIRGPVPQKTDSVALFPYRVPEVASCITEAKFYGSIRAAKLLGYVLAHYLTKHFQQHTSVPSLIILVPIPLSTTRMRERGYCQTERIAKAAIQVLQALKAEAHEASIHLDSTLLVRTRHTVPQTTLSGRQRRKNLIGAFAATKPCNPHATYIVFDDVITTGSTLLAACEALQKAGAFHIQSLAIAHADLS